MRNTIAVAVAAVLAAGGAVGSVAADTHDSAPGARSRQAAPPPGDFLHPRQNAYFPLRPGTVSRYRGTDDGDHFHEQVVVTSRTKVVQGVRTTVVRDVLRRADGSLAESTSDWYAADDRGNVWYFGERTATYDEDGHVESREGSWQAGVHGATAGLIMPSSPVPTKAYRQEFQRGSAEDQAWIVQRGFRVHVIGRTARQALRTLEWSRLEPDVVSEKVYAPGLGIVTERDLAGGTESFTLVSVKHR
ncbi:hypothetical protein [Marmoricola sp. RAF53]|uniref:hypothetical protein n=1 Tax=Marmoricola sp. RAF53 TaxID=3233059 RepID=UPI003F96149E